MCMGGSSPKAPKPVAPPVLPQVMAPIEADTETKSATEEERKRRLAAQGRSDTILTSGLGVESTATTGRKTLG